MSIKKIIITILMGTVAMAGGCRIYTLDTFYFDPEKLDGDYLQPEDFENYYHIRGIIPDSLREQVILDVGGNAVYAFFIPAPETIADPITVVFSNGNDKNINRFWSWVESLWECGYNVFIYDYEGYGKSEGDPSDEACFRDVRAAIDYVRGRPGINTSKIIYMAVSMGSYVATYAAADYIRPELLILESPPASTEALVKDSYLLGLPASYFSDATDFDSEKRIDRIGCPLFIMAGENDDFVVFDRNGDILFAKAREPKELWLVNGAKHTDIKDVVGHAEYGNRISGFVNQYMP
jgi:pimeloyl-ACP methyl ester carboxylesterase